MDRQYVDAVRLLLAVAPVIFESPRFALKGGTALNLFVQYLPRLSVEAIEAKGLPTGLGINGERRTREKIRRKTAYGICGMMASRRLAWYSAINTL